MPGRQGGQLEKRHTKKGLLCDPDKVTLVNFFSGERKSGFNEFPVLPQMCPPTVLLLRRGAQAVAVTKKVPVLHTPVA